MTHPHRNSFDALRMVAASVVFLDHLMGMYSGYEPKLPILGTYMGGAAVMVFFSVSGYLVAGSLLRDGDARRFAASRILRIYPGLIVAQIVTIAVLAPLSDLPVREYLSSGQTWRFLHTNLTGLLQTREFSLPGVFEHSRWHLTNNSLWTIPYEITAYAILLALFKSSPRGRLPLFASAACAVCAATMLFAPGNVGLARFTDLDLRLGAQFGLSFSAGAVLASIPPGRLSQRDLGLAAIATMLLWDTPAFKVAAVLWLSLLAVEIGRSEVLSWYGRIGVGDLSYGLYLYAYPVSNVAVTYFQGRVPAIVLATCAFVLTLGLASLSWQLVERPCLKLKPRGPSKRQVPMASSAVATA